MLATSTLIAHWWQFNYFPHGEAWFHGAVWPNVFVIAVVAPLGYVWSKTKWWPLRPIHHALRGLHAKADETHRKLAEHAALHAEHAENLNALHAKLDMLIEPKRSGKMGGIE